jgi:hypothetical protein
MTDLDLEVLVKRTQEQRGHGFTKVYREMEVSSLIEAVKEGMEDWEFGYTETPGIFVIQSGFARLTGHYPQDYLEKRSQSYAGKNE